MGHKLIKFSNQKDPGHELVQFYHLARKKLRHRSEGKVRKSTVMNGLSYFCIMRQVYYKKYLFY